MSEQILSPLAQAARAALSERGMSARKLAHRLDMKPDTVNDFLNGRRATRRSTTRAICQELGLDNDTAQKGAPL